jgi:hypothetical protein
MAQVEKLFLPSNYKTLSSNPSTTTKKKKKVEKINYEKAFQRHKLVLKVFCQNKTSQIK